MKVCRKLFLYLQSHLPSHALIGQVRLLEFERSAKLLFFLMRSTELIGNMDREMHVEG